MSISNLLQPNNFDIYANNVNTQNIDTVTINDLPYPPEPVLPVLVPNKVLRTNALATDIYWGDVPHGSANQVLVTNPTATGPAWSDSLDLPGNIAADGSLTVGSNASFAQSVDVTDTLTANAINCTTNVNALGDVDCLNLNAGQVNASIISSDNISNSNTISTSALSATGVSSLTNALVTTLTTTTTTNVKNLNLTDLKLKLNGSSASSGQILQYDASSNLTFASLPSSASSNMQIVKQLAVLTNVNTSTNLFTGGGVSVSNLGSPRLTFDLVSTRTIYVNSTGIARIYGQISLNTHNAQGKLVIRNSSTLAAIYIKSLDYVPALTSEQVLDFSFTYNFTAAGVYYEVVMIPDGVGGTVNLLGNDPTYGVSTCTMYLQNQ